MSTLTQPKAPSPADVRAAKQLLGLFPVMAQLWSTTIRSGAGVSGRFKTLGALDSRGPIRSGELAVMCGTTPSGMTEVIEGLVAEGYVRRVDDPTDRRAVMVALTDGGSAELERIRELLTAAVVKVFEGLTAEHRTRLRAALADINEILISPSAKKETRIVR